MIFRVMCDKMMAMGKALAAVFIDYKAAFDSVSHKFIDETLEKAGVSTKARSMFCSESFTKLSPLSPCHLHRIRWKENPK